jgi:hypothetical protein
MIVGLLNRCDRFDRGYLCYLMLEVDLKFRGVIRERTRRLGVRLLANELARREPRDLI